MAAKQKAGSTRARSAGARSKKATSGRKPAARKKAAPKGRAGTKSTRKAAAPTIDTIARRIVRATVRDPSNIRFEDLYAEDCRSQEPVGEPVVGLQAIREKGASWEARVESQSWTARNVFTRPGTIAIEWNGKVTMKDGRTIDFHEVAIHEIKGGKIVAERYIYDPAQLAPPPELVEPPRPQVQRPPPGPPAVDPLDL